MDVIIAVIFFVVAFLFCALIASWLVEGSAAITLFAILIFVCILAASSNKK